MTVSRMFAFIDQSIDQLLSCVSACVCGLSEELLQPLLRTAGVPPSSLSYLSAFPWQPAAPGGAHEAESEGPEGVLAPAWNFYSLVQRKGIFFSDRSVDLSVNPETC